MNTGHLPRSESIEEAQRDFCRDNSFNYVECSPDTKLGFAVSTEGKVPINGLRHPVQGDTNGWYIWCGEEFSSASDFFLPLHTWHVYERHPEVAKVLGLPPGSRFLIAENYVDVWLDASLLEV